MEVLGDPSGVKMAQDASWIASGAEFEDLGAHLVAKMAQVGPKWRQDELGAQDGQLGTILGGILGYILDLERDLSKNNGSVKATNTRTLSVVF